MDVRMMGFVSFFAVVVTLMFSMQQGVMGFKEVKVGEGKGWQVPDVNDTDFYDQWARSKKFHVGDTLRFEYKNDSVLPVDKYGYYHCDQTKAFSTFTDGNTTIKLDHLGVVYFISGNNEHCRLGQRLRVNAVSPKPHPVASPPEAHDPTTQSPSPCPSHSKSTGSKLVQASTAFGVVVAAAAFILF